LFQEDLAAARAALGAEKERSSALGESVRRAQQARREAEQERLRAASAADTVRQKVSSLAARVKALQRQVEEVWLQILMLITLIVACTASELHLSQQHSKNRFYSLP
jgi:chromosome segregation ATPase